MEIKELDLEQLEVVKGGFDAALLKELFASQRIIHNEDLDKQILDVESRMLGNNKQPYNN